MTLPKSNREKQIDLFLNQLESQKEYDYNKNLKIEEFKKKYKNELEDYIFIKDNYAFDKIKKGGYIRYFNLNDELKWGGILIKKVKSNDMDLMVLCNSGCNRFVVSFQKNYIFYKPHQTASDKTRKLFMSALDKYTDYND
tara:strand:- start:791 stop:1210 length:420 start_codon:yes stop_codon:yes gene_type:complete